MPRGSARASVIFAIAAVALAGCTPAPVSPTLPKVIWENGTSPLEADPAVIAARAADLGRALAWNAADFSVAQFTDHHSPDFADKIYTAFRGTYLTRGVDPRALPGPSVWQPVSVDGTELVVCDASDDWYTDSGHSAAYELTSGFLLTITLEQNAAGALVLADKQPSLDECDATGAPIGRFDPVPVVPKTITSAIAPDGTRD